METYRIGKNYEVPTLRMNHPFKKPDGNTVTLVNYLGWYGGALPMLNDFTDDEWFITNTAPPDHMHAHIDWRFLADEEYVHFQKSHAGKNLLEQVILLPKNELEFIHFEIRTLTCHREFPAPIVGNSPTISAEHGDYAFPLGAAVHMRQLQASVKCKALVAGKCPHRGTPASAMIEVSGTLVCPAHGLRFGKRTGVMIPWPEREGRYVNGVPQWVLKDENF